MLPYFVTCSFESIVYRRGEKVTNKAVNLGLCKGISRTTFAWYPDNTGKPAITFDGCDIQWAYDKESDRDRDFLRIANNEFILVDTVLQENIIDEDFMVYGVTCTNQTSHIVSDVASDDVTTTLCDIQRIGIRGDIKFRTISCAICKATHIKKRGHGIS
ncbi:MAG: hypothetical protein JWM44_1533 [Bacilli bacterium]|nr:hypothetical protein [Bacilli bacterium]